MKRFEINPDNPQMRLINQVAECLQADGVIAYPTDTTYGLGCSIFSPKAVKKIYKIKRRDSKKPFSFICCDYSEIAKYAKVSNFAYKILRRHLPGPYTFIFEASRNVPNLMTTRQRTVGIRMPDHAVSLEIVRSLGFPLVTTSVNLTSEAPLSDPALIEDELGGQLDIIVDSGIVSSEPSTVISLVGDCIEVLREGSGSIDWIEEV